MATSKFLAPVVIVIVLLVVGTGAGLYLTRGPGSNINSTSSGGPSKVVQVVAGENFWGSLASELGGTHVKVLSIVSDPNADPHQYESSSANAQAVANANLVIVNGAGYDDWLLRLLSASNNPAQTVLNVQKLIGQPVAPNPHFWYSPYYVNDTVKAMYRDLVSIDSGNAVYYRQQYATLNASLGVYNARIHKIAQQFSGAPVAATEDIFVYLANATKLNLVSPPGFMQAVAEGNDPPAQSIAQFQQLLQGGNRSVRVLVYNQQTITPLTQLIKSMAAENQIPTVGLTETDQPTDASLQDWINGQLIALQNALNAQVLGK